MVSVPDPKEVQQTHDDLIEYLRNAENDKEVTQDQLQALSTVILGYGIALDGLARVNEYTKSTNYATDGKRLHK